MSSQSSFTDRTLVVSGGSRGIGLAIALGAAKRGANVVLLAKTSEPHPRLSGTVDTAVEHFGGIDIVINNASAIATEPTESLSAKKFDLMMDINVRGTFLFTKAALPHLRRSAERAPGAHVITLAPPLNMNPHWLGAHPAYTLSKYGMTLLSLGWAAEYADTGIGFACLWPETYTATAAVSNLADGDTMAVRSRDPEIMADAAVEILSRPAADVNAQCYVDSALLAESGVSDLSAYGGGDEPILDIFVDRP